MFHIFSLTVDFLSLTVTSVFLAVLDVLEIKLGHQYPTLEQNMLGTFALLFTNFGATAAIAIKMWWVDLFVPGVPRKVMACTDFT